MGGLKCPIFNWNYTTFHSSYFKEVLLEFSTDLLHCNCRETFKQGMIDIQDQYCAVCITFISTYISCCQRKQFMYGAINLGFLIFMYQKISPILSFFLFSPSLTCCAILPTTFGGMGPYLRQPIRELKNKCLILWSNACLLHNFLFGTITVFTYMDFSDFFFLSLCWQKFLSPNVLPSIFW